MDHSHDDEGLWDELNHQQSREIEQHHYRRDQAVSERRRRRTYATTWGSFLKERAQQVSTAVAQGLGGSQVFGIGTEVVSNNNINNAQTTTDDGHAYQSLSSLLPGSSSDIDSDLGMNIFGTRQRANNNSGAEPLLQPNNYENNNPTRNAAINNNQNTTTNNSNNNNNQYVFLQPFRLLPQRDGWGAVGDLDVFFAALYQYYYHRGATTLVMKGFVELLTLFFTLALSIFLFAYVDWSKLSACVDESTCHDHFSSYLISHPFSSNQHSWLWKSWMVLYALIFTSYGLFAVWSWWHAYQHALRSKWFMEEQLGIPERKLQAGAVDWDLDVVSKIQQLQQSGQYRIAIHGQADETLDALLIAQRILRKENFMVALFNNPSLLDWSVQLAPNMVFFSKSLEWCLYFCILNFMFNHKYQLRPAFYLDPNSLKRRFFVCGVAHMVFMPFLLFFMTLYFGLQNAYDWKSTKNYLGPREWSGAAKWTLREFNELPHVFERRLEPSYEAAETYLKLFRQNEWVTALGRIMVFIGGSLGAVLVAFAAMNDAILLHVKIADWNMLWYAGVMAAVYSTGKAMLPSQEKDASKRHYHANLSQEMDMALEQVAKHTHHYPISWKGRGWDKTTTYKAFTKMFKYKAQLFLQELLAIIVAPYILCVSLPQCAERVCDFILAVRAEVAGAGDMCGYATFDFDKFGDDLWEGKTLGQPEAMPNDPRHVTAPPPLMTGSLSESIMQSGNVLEATQQYPVPRAQEGKMEKSFFSFKAAHPTWKCSGSGQDLVHKLEQYQQEESAALARERQLYVEAAARQLETLAQLERQRQQNPASRHGALGAAGLVVDSTIMNDSYIRSPTNAGTDGSTHTAADAGAGSGLNRAQQPAKLPTVAENNNNSGPLDLGGQQVTRTETPPPFGMASPVQSPRQQGIKEEEQPPPFAAPVANTSESPPAKLRPSPPVPMAELNQNATLSNSAAPPPNIFPPSVPRHTMTNSALGAGSTLASAAALIGAGSSAPSETLALSSELRRILNMSTLDQDVGSIMMGSMAIPPPPPSSAMFAGLSGVATQSSQTTVGMPVAEEERSRLAERQYLWLERYHSHNLMASSRQMPRQPHPSQPWSPPQLQQSHPSPTQQQQQQQQQSRLPYFRRDGPLQPIPGSPIRRPTGDDRLGGSSIV